jgi:YD repeat-containing protein
MLSATDPNGKTITADYTTDPYFWRPDYTLDQIGNKTTLAYSGQTAVESALLFNSNQSVTDLRSTVDGFGRSILNQKGQTPSPTEYDSAETDYNVMGQPSRSTMPFQAAAGATNSSAPSTTTTYDALGRPTLVTDGGGGTVSYQYINNDVLQTAGPIQNFSKQLEYDGLGRLTSVCEITAVSGSGSCGQSNAKGFLTKYTYDALGNLLTVTQNAQPGAIGGQQTRTYAYDNLSRLTSEKNPETGNLATNYTYDSVSYGGCVVSANPTDLVLKTDPHGNGSCYVHDALHRVLSIGQTSGSPNGAVTPDSCFTYDSATVNGVSMPNAKLHLAEAYTVSRGGGCGAAKLTDEGFGYDADGNPTDLYESTPHSGGYYHSKVSYWPNGALDTLQLLNNSGGAFFPTLTYGAEGEGRPSSVTAASGQSPVSSATYTLSGTTEPIGSLTNVTFGSLDSDSFQYNPNTGRMKQYSLNVNGQSLVGQLNWNSNGTLGQLAITDPFNSADNQTCTDTYDDLARVSGNNCTPSVWAQTFSYDPFGNISKSGSISWQPTYSTASNNQYLAGWNGVSYDPDGNLLNDSFNLYTWDGYGNLASANGAAITYDALDRMVENDNGSYQLTYSPGGTQPLATFAGQTLEGTHILLPGGAMAIYNSSGLQQYNHPDWLGSAKLFSSPTRTAQAAMSYAPFGEGYAGGISNGFPTGALCARRMP